MKMCECEAAEMLWWRLRVGGVKSWEVVEVLELIWQEEAEHANFWTLTFP